MDSATPTPLLNEGQARALSSAFSHLEDLFAGEERAARASDDASPFAPFLPDVRPAERAVILDSLASVRAKMERALRALGLAAPRPRTRALGAIQTSLSFAEIALQDLSATRLRGYGRLDPGAAELVERLAADLARSLERLSRYAARAAEPDLAARLARLERAPFDLERLRAIERIVSRRGLVEFRPSVESLLETLETGAFEIAFLGRVSCGKSSLLNALLGEPILPVGVRPVTAVPTRVVWGERPVVRVRFADAPGIDAPLDRLAEFVSESQNPNNRKRVTRVTVELPANGCADGVALVDTPGLGSLATAGARASYTDLPRCDLGVLLVDGGSVLSREEIDLLRSLHDSGIPALAAITKADRLAPAEREDLRSHAREEIRRHLGLEISVGVVSAAAEASLAREWFEAEVRPLLARSRELLAASAARKLAILREGVIASLRASLRSRERADGASRQARSRIEEIALEAEGAIQQATARCQARAEGLRGLRPAILRSVAASLAEPAAGSSTDAGDLLLASMAEASSQVADGIHGERIGLRDRLRALAAEAAQAFSPESPARPEIELDLIARPTLEAPEAAVRRDLPVPGWRAFGRR